MLTSDPTLPPKPRSTCRLHRDTSTQGQPFKTGKGNFSPTFRQTEKDKQNKKTDESVSNARRENTLKRTLMKQREIINQLKGSKL